MTEAFMLAQLRVWRTIQAPEEDAESAALHAAAARAGRRLVVLRGFGPQTELTTGWLEESQLTPDDTGGPGGAGEGAIVVLAACLSCCWPDPDAPIFPGLPTTLEELRHTVAPLNIQNVTHAVNRLRKWGYLTPDSGDGTIRLGPLVATWPDADADRLRREHTRLPSVRGGADD